MTRLVYLTFVFHWERGQHIEFEKSFCQLCGYVRTRAFERSVREPFFGGRYLQISWKYIESQPKMKSLEFKSQAKSDYARKSDVSSIPHVPSTHKLFSALCLPKWMRHQIITLEVDRFLVFLFYRQPNEISEKTKRFIRFIRN